MATRKTIVLTIQIFVSKVIMSLLFNMLSRLTKEQVSFHFMASITTRSDFGAQENKVCRCFHCFPNYLPGRDGTGCHDLSFLNAEF